MCVKVLDFTEEEVKQHVASAGSGRSFPATRDQMLLRKGCGSKLSKQAVGSRSLPPMLYNDLVPYLPVQNHSSSEFTL